MSILPKIVRINNDRATQIRQKMLRHNAQIGGQFFGEVPNGHDRQFFCLDQHSWVWHETWIDTNNKKHSLTTRYDVRPNGIFKVQNGGSYQSLSANETRNLYQAAQLYLKRIIGDYERKLNAV